MDNIFFVIIYIKDVREKVMKRILILELWIMMLAWSLYLSNFCFLAMLFLIAGFLLAFKMIKSIDYWRFVFIFSISLLFSLLLSFYKEDLNLVFLLFISLNNAYVDEIFYKLNEKSLRNLFIIVLTCFLVFVTIAILIPYSSLIPSYKRDLFINIGLIFVPLIVFMSLCLVQKCISCYKGVKIIR